MRLASMVSDSIVDGPGLRLTVFTQGCLHACPGCHNPETHDPGGGEEVSLASLLEKLKENPLTEGLTLSGGEPFLQAADCARLAAAAQALGLTVWVYSGFRYEALLAARQAAYDALLAQTDVLVDGPYVAAERDLLLTFRGSRNQRLIDVRRSRAAGRVVLWQEAAADLAHFSIPES